MEHHEKEYVSAIKQEAKILREQGFLEKIQIDTIYIGGGTPSLLAAPTARDLVDSLMELFAIDRKGLVEASLECNPESVNKPLLETLRDAGINRISLGIQDLTSGGLEILGRIHSPEDAIKACKLVRDVGFEELCVDIIYGLPGQDTRWLSKTLVRLIGLEPTHISAYELTLEDGTPLKQLVTKGEISLPSQERSLELTQFLEDFLNKQGFRQYEISNFAVPGHECVHNINYWMCGDYVGLGCGAVSFMGGTRYFNTKGLPEYMKRIQTGRLAFEERETLDIEARFRESFIMGLRMTKGIDRNLFITRFGIDPFKYYGKSLERMCSLGLMEAKEEHSTIRLTKRGRYISNYVLSYFV